VPLPVRRLLAWLVDWACILVWVGITAAVGVPLYLAGVVPPQGALALNIIAALVVVVPIVVAAGILESRSGGATPGKRLLRLGVRRDGGAPSFGAALARNALKIGLPWIVGHAAVYAIVLTSASASEVPAWVWVLTALSYVLPLVYVATLFVGAGRTPYDRVAGTRVLRAG
jgi:uncharacterized RDD family membrane protein YckC